jgi:stage II sporulation protein E
MPGQFTADFQADTVQEHYHNPKNRVLTFKKHRPRGVFLNNIINILLALLLSRFMIPGGIFCAGVAFALATTGRQLRLWEKLLVLIGIFLGTLSVKGLLFAGVISSSLLTIYIFNEFWYRQKRTSLRQLWIFIIWIIFRLTMGSIMETTLYQFFVTGVELVLSYILIVFFQISFKFLDNPLKAFSKFTLPALTIMIVLTLGGTRDLVFQSLNLTEVLAAFLLVMASYLGGGGIGAVMGISIALVLGVNTENLITLIATYSIAGFLGGFLKDLKKWGTLLGTCLGLYFVMQQLHVTSVFTVQNISWGIGMASFVLIPRRYLSQMSNYFPSQEPCSSSPEEQKQLREVLNNRLNDLAAIFEEVAKSFNDNSQEPIPTQKMDLYSLLDQVCTKNCQHCNGYESCWGENFYSTYREIFDLIAFAELYGSVGSKHLKGRLTKNCFQQFKLLATINQLFERYQADHIWQRKVDESKVFLANQLQGVSSIISSLAVEITRDVSFKTEIEGKIRQGLNRIGMSIKEVSVLSCKEQGLEIRIKQRNCNQKHECQYLAGAMIGRLLDREYTVWERSCHFENENCAYCLTPAHNYEIKTTICKLPKDGNEFSGDNQGLHELKDGHFAATLSDGMGHGSKASAQSKATVTILEKLLGSGIDSDFAVKMVNSILLLRSPEESFATVDLAIIDLYTARAEFIKIGAATTYVKRGREVWGIKSTSLPAGILNAVDLERTNMNLQAGDLVIMVTDGILDSKVNQPGKEEWMIRALKQVEVVGPEALGEYLLNLAKINQDGVPKDDMTVIVLQILEKSFNA